MCCFKHGALAAPGMLRQTDRGTGTETTGDQMSGTDTSLGRGLLRSALVDHACGHRHAHLIPLVMDGSGSLLTALELIASQPCPACLLAEHGIPPMLPERRVSMEAM